MSTNPYKPSKAELSDRPKPAMAAWQAVLLGLAVDIGGTTVFALLLGAVYAAYLLSTGANPEQIGAAMADVSPTSGIFIVGTLGGGMFSFLGGMVCTRCAQRSDYSLGLVLAGISASFGLLFSFNDYSAPTHLMLTALTFAAVLLGTKSALVKKEA